MCEMIIIILIIIRSTVYTCICTYIDIFKQMYLHVYIYIYIYINKQNPKHIKMHIYLYQSISMHVLTLSSDPQEILLACGGLTVFDTSSMNCTKGSVPPVEDSNQKIVITF